MKAFKDEGNSLKSGKLMVFFVTATRKGQNGISKS